MIQENTTNPTTIAPWLTVQNAAKAVAFYKDVFNLEKLDSGEGDAFFKLGEHQFLAIFEVERQRDERLALLARLVGEPDGAVPGLALNQGATIANHKPAAPFLTYLPDRVRKDAK